MQKPSEGIVRSDAGQRLNKRFLERFTRASAHAPQDKLSAWKRLPQSGKNQASTPAEAKAGRIFLQWPV